IRFHDLKVGSFQVDDLRVTAHYMNHPALTLGYRLESPGASLVYAVDHEPLFWKETGDLPESPAGVAREQEHIDFLKDASLVIHDAQYTGAEYPGRVGWGHSPMEYVVDAALNAGARRLALFH